jgi:ribokinase
MDAFPQPGETVMADDLEEVAGGKGLNQAVAAARTTPTSLICCVGDDEAGELLLARLRTAGVRTDHVQRLAVRTGRAFIHVRADGENTIAVMSLANQSLRPEAVLRSLNELRPGVVLCQLEIPMESVEAAAEWASDNGARFVLNASPLRALPPRLLAQSDPIIVNLGEAQTLVGGAADGIANDDGPVLAGQLAQQLGRETGSVVVTDGPRGVYVTVGELEGIHHIAGHAVRSPDSTGAGDEFAGAMASALARGLDPVAAARAGNDAAARIVQLSRHQR